MVSSGGGEPGIRRTGRLGTWRDEIGTRISGGEIEEHGF